MPDGWWTAISYGRRTDSPWRAGCARPGGWRSARPAVAADRREDAVLEYLRGARELVAAQRDVLLGYLGADGASPRTPLVAPEPEAREVFAPRPAAEETESRPLTRDELMDAVLEIVHLRTGYPREMLDPALDLEADLSVDSIKRVEIIGALADRIGLPRGADGPAESAVEELSRLKTISGIVDWIVARDATAEQDRAPGRPPIPRPSRPPARTGFVPRYPPGRIGRAQRSPPGSWSRSPPWGRPPPATRPMCCPACGSPSSTTASGSPSPSPPRWSPTAPRCAPSTRTAWRTPPGPTAWWT